MSPFRSGGFIVNMHIAWTSLFLAVFYRNKTKPYYVDTASGKPLKIGDENKHWQLAKCASVYWKGQDSPARENIRFFIGLRNKIEHALMPELDITIFGECQAHLINFENLLTLEFGAKYALQETLAMSLQFSALRDNSQRDAARKLQSALRPNIRNYVDKF